MKIVKAQKKKTDNNERFGVWIGQAVAEMEVDDCQWGNVPGSGGSMAVFAYLKFGSSKHSHFVWFDSLKEVKEFRDALDQQLGDLLKYKKNKI